MSATVAAALKKIAVAVLTNKKLRRVVLGITVIHGDTRFTDIGEDEFQKITLALTAVAENEDIACSLILGSAVEVHKDIRAVFVTPDI